MTHPMQQEMHAQVAKMADLALQQSAEVRKKITALKQDEEKIVKASLALQQARDILAPEVLAEGRAYDDDFA